MLGLACKTSGLFFSNSMETASMEHFFSSPPKTGESLVIDCLEIE